MKSIISFVFVIVIVVVVANFEYLRNTNGMPPRIAFFPSKTANLLFGEKKKEKNEQILSLIKKCTFLKGPETLKHSQNDGIIVFRRSPIYSQRRM